MIAHRQTSHPLLPKNQTRISVQWLVHVWSKPYLLPSSPDYPRPRPTLSSQSLVHCIDAARSVIHIASQSHALIPPSHHLALYCQYLWSSAVILLLCEIQARDEIIEAVDWQAEACRRCLQTLEPVWPGSKKLKELLNDVASRAKEAMVSQNHQGKSANHLPIRIRTKRGLYHILLKVISLDVNRLTCPAAR